MDYGVDANRTLELHSLLLLTDNLAVTQTLLTRQCNRTAGQLPCLHKVDSPTPGQLSNMP